MSLRAAVGIACAWACTQAAGAGCTLVYSHGRNFDPEQPAANAQWNELNQGLVDSLEKLFIESGQRVVPVVMPVQSRDIAANVGQALERAGAEGCGQVLDAAVFGDGATEMLVVRLRLHAISRPAGPPRVDAPSSIGPARVTVQRELPLNPRTLARIQSGELIRQMWPELRDHLSP
jgi:hypothetical protein